MTKQKKINRFIDKLLKEPMVRKHLVKEAWLSGGQTWVHPVTVDNEGQHYRSITLQWNTKEARYGPFIKRIVAENCDILRGGVFRRSDGSCPSTIIFFLR